MREKQHARRAQSRHLRNTLPEFQHEMNTLVELHYDFYHAMVKLASIDHIRKVYKVGPVALAAFDWVDRLPDSSDSDEVVSVEFERPLSATNREVNYSLLLASMGVIEYWDIKRKTAPVSVEHNHRKRDLWSKMGYDNMGVWWMAIGGYSDKAQVDVTGRNALHHAAEATFYEQQDQVILDLVKGCGLHVLNALTSNWPIGYTPLMLLCCGSNVKLNSSISADALIRAQTDVNVECSIGNTALLLAAWTGVTDLCKALVDNGANLHHCRHDGKNAALLAMGAGTDTGKYLSLIHI